jgi:hypothetical protein
MIYIPFHHGLQGSVSLIPHKRVFKVMSTALVRKTSLAVNAATLVIFAFCFLLLALNCAKGLDITDRSYYLLWADQPENVTGSLTHFGFVTGVIYDLVGQNIAAFRLAGLVIMAALTLAFAWGLHRYLDQKSSGQDLDLSFLPLGLAALCGSLFYYHRWLHAPSYNWLALTAVLITVSGLLWWSKNQRTWPGAIIVAAGGTFAFTAKPTTALMLGIMAAIFVLIHRPDRRGWRFIFLSAIISLTLLWGFSWFYFGSVQAYVANLRLGHELSAALGGGHTIGQTLIRSGRQIMDFLIWWGQTPFVTVYVVLAIMYTGLRTYKPDSCLTRSLGYCLPALILVLFAYLAYLFWSGGSGLYLSTILLTLLGLLLLTGGSLLVGQDQDRKPTRRLVYSGLLLTLFLITAAMSPAFGTISDLVRRMSQYAVFLAAAASMMLNLISPPQIKGLMTGLWALGLGVLLSLVLMNAYQYPYRLPEGITNQDTSVSISGGRLFLDDTTAHYVQDLKKHALRAGWTTDNLLIDMTGGSPGASLILQARIPGTPWLLGNYPGSDAFASKALGSVPEELLEKAWILTAPQGERRLGLGVLAENGLDFPQDYARVGSVTTGHRNERQILWKPVIEERGRKN